MRAAWLGLSLLLFASAAQAKDSFDAIRCGQDIPKVLIGKVMPDGTVVKIEAAHTAIQLKDIGAEEVSDTLQMVEWSICGADYNILVDANDVMRDVLPFPAHSRQTPEYSGICRIDGKDSTEEIFALLDNRKGFDPDTTHHYSPSDPVYLPALQAWRLDEKHAKVVAIPVKGLTCPRAGINSVDGGP